MEARHVAKAAVSSNEQHASCKRYLDGRDDIQTIDQQGASRDRLWVYPPVCPRPAPPFCARATTDGHALTLAELIPVTDDLEGRPFRVAAGTKPAQIVDGLSKRRRGVTRE